MTRTTKTLVAVFAFTVLFCVSFGGGCISTGMWWHAAAAYTVAAVCLIGLLREIGHAIPPGDYTDDIDDPATPRPGKRRTLTAAPGLLRRARAAHTARRELRRTHCGCDRYWLSFGTEHDDQCPMRRRSSR